MSDEVFQGVTIPRNNCFCFLLISLIRFEHCLPPSLRHSEPDDLVWRSPAGSLNQQIGVVLFTANSTTQLQRHTCWWSCRFQPVASPSPRPFLLTFFFSDAKVKALGAPQCYLQEEKNIFFYPTQKVYSKFTFQMQLMSQSKGYHKSHLGHDKRGHCYAWRVVLTLVNSNSEPRKDHFISLNDTRSPECWNCISQILTEMILR